MILSTPCLVYLFLETVELDRSRDFFERVLGFPLIETEPHAPHHRHGVVKYDAGGLILSLNLTDWSKFSPDASDALVSRMAVNSQSQHAVRGERAFVEATADGIRTDPHGHHFELGDTAGPPAMRELRLAAPAYVATCRFYRDVLALPLRGEEPGRARFAAGLVDIVLEERSAAVDGRALQLKSYLPVFYTPDIVATQAELIARGVSFRRPRPGFSEIGGSSRFEDPSGHTLCLYEPSEECLTWGSGQTLMELIGSSTHRSAAERSPRTRAVCP